MSDWELRRVQTLMDTTGFGDVRHNQWGYVIKWRFNMILGWCGGDACAHLYMIVMLGVIPTWMERYGVWLIKQDSFLWGFSFVYFFYFLYFWRCEDSAWQRRIALIMHASNIYVYSFILLQGYTGGKSSGCRPQAWWWYWAARHWGTGSSIGFGSPLCAHTPFLGEWRPCSVGIMNCCKNCSILNMGRFFGPL